MSSTASQTYIPSLTDKSHYSETNNSDNPHIVQQYLIDSGRFGDPENLSLYAKCLTPLLMALGWQGQFRQLCESLPYKADNISIAQFRNTMAILDFTSDVAQTSVGQIDKRLLPCVFETVTGGVYVILSIDSFGTTVFNAKENCADVLDISHDEIGQAIFFYSTDNENIPHHVKQRLHIKDNTSWSKSVLGRFSAVYKKIFLISFVLSVLALASPFFIMATYSIVIGTQSTQTLLWFCGGILFAFSLEFSLRRIRSRMMNYVSSRLEYIFSTELFSKILNLPLSYTESATISAQIARLQDFGSVSKFFNSPLFSILTEIPFVTILIAGLFFISPKMALLSIVTLGLFSVIAIIMKKTIKKNIQSGAQSHIRKQEMVVETLDNHSDLILNNGLQSWFEQYRQASGNASYASMKTFILGSSLESIGYLITMLGGIGILTIGIHDVLDSKMNVGALIASVILLWRIMNPVQVVFSNLPRYEQVRSSLKQIDSLMYLEKESDGYIKTSPLNKFKGEVEFTRVSLRYNNQAEPALVGVTFKINPGELIAVTGANGAGKSSLFKVLTNLYKPQAGMITIDGIDIRQVVPTELRHNIGYMHQNGTLIPGSISENLRLSDPTALYEDIQEALEIAQAWEAVCCLPDGLDTKVKDAMNHDIPFSLEKKIVLARAFLSKPGILLIDEIDGVFTEEEILNFLNNIQSLEQPTTIMMITQDPQIINRANRLFLMDKGELKMSEDNGKN